MDILKQKLKNILVTFPQDQTYLNLKGGSLKEMNQKERLFLTMFLRQELQKYGMCQKLEQ